MLSNEQAKELFWNIVTEITNNLQAIKSLDVTDEAANTALITQNLAPIIINTEKLKTEYLEHHDLEISPYDDITPEEYIPVIIFFVLAEDIEFWEIFDDEGDFSDTIEEEYPELFEALFYDNDFSTLAIADFVSIFNACEGKEE